MSNNHSRNMAVINNSLRYPNVAGIFYDADKRTLRKRLGLLLNNGGKSPEGLRNKRIHAVISPHAGYEYCGTVMASIYQLLYGSTINKIILIGPSHTQGFQAMALDTKITWQTPLGLVPIDVSANEHLKSHEEFKTLPFVFNGEHSLEVQVPFIQHVLSSFTLIPLCSGQNLPHKKIADAIFPLLTGSTLVVISSDFSHYHPEHIARFMDHRSISAILSKDTKQIDNYVDACGKDGIMVLNEIAVLKNWKPIRIDYKTSGDITGDKQSVVGYAGIAYV